MKKRILTNIVLITIVIVLIIMVWLTSTVVANQPTNEYDKEELILLITEAQNIKNNAHIMAESARMLGWTNNDKLIKELQNKWSEADEQEKIYQTKLNEIIAVELEELRQEEMKWENKALEYPTATYIWRYMKSLGWNDYVCAGIMGNLMAEVGGQTLNINYNSSSSGYYGMCQWNSRHVKVWNTGLESQCNYLKDTIKYEFDTYGFNYQKGFNFDSFLSMNDAQQAALAFAKSYERCASGSYNIRQQNALKAYDYFVD